MCTLGYLLPRASGGILVHLVLAFPSGRLRTWERRWVAGVGYGAAFGLTGIEALFTGPTLGEAVHANLLLVADLPTVAIVLDQAVQRVGAAVAVAVCVLLARQWRDAGPPTRRLLTPVFVTGLVGGASTLVSGLFDAYAKTPLALQAVYWAAFALLPAGFLSGLLRLRLRHGAVGELLARMADPACAGDLGGVLANTLGDPTLQVALWQADPGRYVDTAGRRVVLPLTDPSRAHRLIHHGEQPIAVLVCDAALSEEPRLLDAVAEALRLTLAHQQLTAVVRDVRRRAVATTDSERRRWERDLHDGAQHHLVMALWTLREGHRQLGEPLPPEVAALLQRSADQLDEVLGALRDLARRIHPVLLGDAGLVPAVRALLERTPLRVTLEVGVDHRDGVPSPRSAPAAVSRRATHGTPNGGPGGLAVSCLELPRLAEDIEAAAYFVIAEALTNVVKHAAARTATVAITYRPGPRLLIVEVTDDGVGGADASLGTGLRGLHDRVGALGGQLVVTSRPRSGTLVRATIPDA
ncbi:histidine kinase [Frankia sp. Ag45/Mut15]|uniref:histidine kinase n=1 Tax=Frankia umida TaxID=573489 RepID=A0ABT0K0Q5_9ACTN|nr:histidine kinase [Frankia umida]MCK9877366.1 histidine kinase [Frankia umida]